MNYMSSIENPDVAHVFEGYPGPLREKMLRLRQLILDTASEAKDTNNLGVPLEWGEPSYLTKGGSTVRINCKSRAPEQYAVYFNCNTSLVDTFRAIYGDMFTFAGNRAIVFNKTDELPI